ncbi:hypothetical protein [Lentibacillus juripiscarius]|uniref:Uncharacterized protein n=1 Tax=Lentibacillus juripiscarius TaxID=257446 RepID=A0ABW5V7P3_9BACI
MELEEKDGYFTANNAEELLSALKNKESHIIIQEDFKKEFEENTQLPLTENEQMGFQLGFRGTAGIWGEIIFQVINKFSKGSRQQKKIDSKLRKYSLKKS